MIMIILLLAVEILLTKGYSINIYIELDDTMFLRLHYLSDDDIRKSNVNRRYVMNCLPGMD
jgi:hypothetical protein